MNMTICIRAYFFELANKHVTKMSKIRKFIINLPKIIEKAENVQKMILITIKIDL